MTAGRATLSALAATLVAAVVVLAPAGPTPASRPASARAAYAGLTPLARDGLVRDWLVLASVPYSLNPKAVEGRDEFIYGERRLRPRAGYVFRSDRLAATKVIRWRAVRAAGGTVDFAERRASMHYAVTYVVSDKPVTVKLKAGGAKYVLLRVNGSPVREEAKLAAGLNVVLARVRDDDGGATFRLQITPAAGLGVTLAPTAEPDERRLRSVVEPDPAFVLFPKPPGRVSYLPERLAPQVKRMTGKAMKLIVDSQQANGAWSDTQYPDSVGVTALCCLALMAEGNLPRQGPRGKALDKGLEFLLGSFTDGGVCASVRVEGYGVMYGHALATLALLEAGGNMPWRPETGDRISKALQAIARCQKLDGGWRYQLTKTGDSDISVTTTVLWVLGQAKRYGYAVPAESITRAVRFVEQCGKPDGRFMYRLSGKTKVQPHSGVGVAALYGVGRIKHPLLGVARAQIAVEYQRYSVEDLSKRRYVLFGAFFASLAMYSSGYDTWAPWYTKMTQVIAATQQPGGDVRDRSRNRIYTTALAAIILQAPNGYLSIYVQ